MNVLSCLLIDFEKTKHVEGIQFARKGSRITHLMYDDDLVILFKASMQATGNLKAILDNFYTAADMSINKQKSNIVLNPNTPPTFKKFFSLTFGVNSSNKLGRYLGVFVDDCHDYKHNFNDLVSKIQRRLVWVEK